PASFRWWTTLPRSSASCWRPHNFRTCPRLIFRCRALICGAFVRQSLRERIMTDPTATANNSDTATTADNEPAPPDAAALAKEVADYKDKLLRALADMENLRRRTDREVADVRAYGVSSLARDVVGVADNLRRALAAAGESAAEIEGPAKALHARVELIERAVI